MKQAPIENQTALPATPRFKNLLIDLLVVGGLAGLSTTAYLLHHTPAITPPPSSILPLNQTNIKLPEMPALMPPHKKVEITFQGLITGEKKVIAMVNDHMATVGSAIEGVRIADITPKRKLIIEYGDGQRAELHVGQTVSVPVDAPPILNTSKTRNISL